MSERDTHSAGERAGATSSADTADREPLPIWFFVGLILGLYGLVILASGLISGPGTTVFGSTRPELWWGGVMTVFGAIFLGVGLRGR